jgi:hypothetical protein
MVNMAAVRALPSDGEDVLITGARPGAGAQQAGGATRKRTGGKKATKNQRALLREARKRRKTGKAVTKAHANVLSAFGTPGEKRSVTRARRKAANAAAAKPAGKVAKKRTAAKKTVTNIPRRAANAGAAKKRVAKRPRNG